MRYQGILIKLFLSFFQSIKGQIQSQSTFVKILHNKNHEVGSQMLTPQTSFSNWWISWLKASDQVLMMPTAMYWAPTVPVSGVLRRRQWLIPRPNGSADTSCDYCQSVAPTATNDTMVTIYCPNANFGGKYLRNYIEENKMTYVVVHNFWRLTTLCREKKSL